MIFLWFSHGFLMVFPLKPPFSLWFSYGFHLSQAQITIINVLLMLAARWFGEREVHLTKCGNSASGAPDTPDTLW